MFLYFPFFPPLSIADSIQSHPNVFLEGEQTHGGPTSQHSSETDTEGGGGGGGEEGGRRASVTSVESEMSICSMGQLGNTIANSEWEENKETERPHCRLSFISWRLIQVDELSQLLK